MNVSFIVTSYNILPWIETCLKSLVPCTKPGDHVYLVDDGSEDGTDRRLEQLAAAGFGQGVTVHTILLGTNTFGGVGIAANTGLSRALARPDCDAVFFVDGDDWLAPEQFLQARERFATSQADLLICGYQEYNEAAGQHQPASDQALWSGMSQLPRDEAEACRSFALQLNPVPWRKFYRANFLRQHPMRFPEGDFFFEDNPFHWEVCLRAKTILFSPAPICSHRLNRPGQTMASRGPELQAFFSHYYSIRHSLESLAPQRASEANDWLLRNMDWHLRRLQPESYWSYAGAAAEVVASWPEAEWSTFRRKHGTNQTAIMLASLRQGQVAAVVSAWQQQHNNTQMRAIHERLAQIDESLRHHPEPEALAEIARFKTILALPHPQPF